MKAKDARKALEGLSGEELYKQACELYELEIDQLVHVRSHGKKPTAGVVESAVKQVADWFHKVYPGLDWENEQTPKNIIEWESGEAYVRNKLVDPTLVRWGERTRREMMKGTPLPMLEAMKTGDLEAAGAMMMASIRRDAKRWGEIFEKRKEFAEKYGLRECPYGTEKRHCEHQTTYVLDKSELPTSTDDLIFVCDVDICAEGKA